ncbi:NAD-dependent epimerase/dehydratase family protein [Halopseudomonas bauzanensis]|uniref:Nucleoside-diphosphate-sugar epimerase n=1 Tax=Halopseudomonas bauzanensis TaxID=653930 RepID=A0A1I4J6Q5_9GAMM|nr:NAD-dependent epimerase/dehydratase family protein [Halopseudomonas bauzanensis]SER65606.1 Nucleoside-diphosphate-sugar epimerase [Halopseudomonas bauzanensis]SFL62249.1 Nucleoside-diphosphate-sugar epimerase [Halopseudomonas bauzanensis]
MISPCRVLITGAAGFIGRKLIGNLSKRPGLSLVASSRSQKIIHPDVCMVKSPSLEPGSDWRKLLIGIDTVVHLAGRAHMLKDQTATMALFHTINCEGTLEFARQASESGVKRFVFISSIGVNGSQTFGHPFTEQSLPAPEADYGVSKLEAEQGLWDLLTGSQMELVVIRPPLVYAADAPGNFGRLLRLVKTGLPLPFGLTHNQRSMVALENLVDFIALCMEHPKAANETFLISDQHDMSTPDIIRHIAHGMGREARFLPVTIKLLELGAALIGKRKLIEQLCGSLVVDSTKSHDLLGWRPIIGAEQALQDAGRQYLSLK